MRLALVLLLIHGLVPALGEVVETVVHLAEAGHLAHTEADGGDLGDQGHEHGCGTTQHQCDCCTSQPMGVRSAAAALPAQAPASPVCQVSCRLRSLHAPAPPYRPPIAA
jgi:hypothetical protein